MIRKEILLSNGETISYHEQGSGSKTLVLIHGNSSSSVYYKPLFERLPQNLRVIAPDLRGFCNSSYTNSFDSLKELASDVNELLEMLKVTSFDVVGWSLGGGVAMELVLMNKNANKLILVASTTHYGYPLYQKDSLNQPIIGKAYLTKEQMAKDPVQVLPLLKVIETQNIEMMKSIYNAGIYLVNKPTEEDQILYAEESLKQRCLVDADWAISTFNLSDKNNGYMQGNGQINNIINDTLHILGDRDLMVPEFMLEQNIEAIKNSTVIRYENCAHSPFVDKPEEITKDLLEFIK
ncbi:MAG: alpha/beta hydrolase [Acholeplasmataceae bacterium]|nr:alpha/beta hydrolase [Acholeplasmataceae bacterium]